MRELISSLLESKPSAERMISIDTARKAYDESGVETSFFTFASLLGFTSDEIRSQRHLSLPSPRDGRIPTGRGGGRRYGRHKDA